MDKKTHSTIIHSCHPSSWFIDDHVVGQGGNGVVFRACKSQSDCPYAAKLIPIGSDFEFREIVDEVAYLQRASDKGVSQKFYEAYECSPFDSKGKSFFREKKIPVALKKFMTSYEDQLKHDPHSDWLKNKIHSNRYMQSSFRNSCEVTKLLQKIYQKCSKPVTQLSKNSCS